MRMLRRSAVGVAVAMCFGTSAHPQEPAPPDHNLNPYLSFLPGHVFADKELAPDRHGVSLTGIFGKPLSPHFSLELNGSGAILETGREEGTDFYQTVLSLDAVFNFLDAREHRWRPYALLGVGGVHDDFYPNDRDGTGLLFEGGLGIATQPLLWNTVAFRLDARYLHDRREGGNGETRVSLGVEIPLGRVERVVEIRTVEKGESQLQVNPELSDDDRERNRRVELRVIDGR